MPTKVGTYQIGGASRSTPCVDGLRGMRANQGWHLPKRGAPVDLIWLPENGRHEAVSGGSPELPGLDADDHGQMQPSLAGGDIRDIPDPRRRSGSGGKLPIQQVGGELR